MSVQYGAEVDSIQPCYGPGYAGACCYDGNGELIVAENGQPILYPLCDPALCDPAYIASQPPEMQRELNHICRYVGTEIPEQTDDCIHRDAERCRPAVFLTVDALDLTHQELEEAARDIDVRSRGGAEFEGDVEALLVHGLAMLRDSLDIVASCCCQYLGPDSKACECLIRRINGKHDFIVYPEGRGSDHWMSSGTGNNILVPVDGQVADQLQVYEDAIRDGSEYAVCQAVVGIAEAILHELMHKCLPGGGEDGHTPPFDYGWLEDAPEDLQQKCDMVDLMTSCLGNKLRIRFGCYLPNP